MIIPSSTQTSPQAIPASHRLLLILLVLVTFATHLAVGVYYVTGPMSPFRGLTLKSSGDTFLAVFPGWNAAEELDDAAYNRAAVEILNTGIPRDHTGSLFFYAPVYAYLVAGCYWLGGVRLFPLAVVHAIFSALSCGLLAVAAYWVAPRCRFIAALITAALYLTNVRLAMYVGYVSPTLLLVFLFSIAVWAVARTFTPGRLSIFAAALILATGTQAGFFFVTLAGVVWLLIRFFKTWNRAELIAATIILLFAVTKNIMPPLLHQDPPGSVGRIGRAVLWEANNPYYESMGMFSLWERRPGNPWTRWKMSADERQRHEMYLNRGNHDPVQAALLWIRENPVYYLKLTVVRFWTTLGPFTGMMSPRNRLISLFVWLLSFPAGAYGWWLCWRVQISGFATAVAFAVVASSTLVIVEWYLRYRFPLDALLMVFAGIAYSSLWSRFATSRSIA